MHSATQARRKGFPATAAATVPEAGAGAVLAVLNEAADQLPACPHCRDPDVQRWGYSGGVQRFRCKSCSRSFNALTGTPLARLRRRDLWLEYAQALNEGLSIRAAGRRLGIHHNTTFRWRHRWLISPSVYRDTTFRDSIEVATLTCVDVPEGEQPWRRVALPAPADEGPAESGQPLRRERSGRRSKVPAPSDQHAHLSATAGEAPPIVVLIARDRHGATLDGVLDALDSHSVETILAPLLDPAPTVLCTAEPAVLEHVARAHGITLHPAAVTGPGTAVHLAHVQAYIRRLEYWMRRFLGVSARYLRHYLGWRRLLDRHCPPPPPLLWLRSALGRDQPPTVAVRQAAAA